MRAASIYESRIQRRILVTGSRWWDDELLMGSALLDVWHPDALLLSGHASRGADRMAEMLWEGWGGRVARYPANWNRACDPDCHHGTRPTRADGTSYCPYAGFVRNQAMVDSGADVCVAFLKIGARNRGTRDCMERAEAAGIPIVEVPG